MTYGATETINATVLNREVRDNMLETAVAKVTTAGDTVYATAANALARLAIGAANTVMTSSGSAPQWSTSLSLAGSLTAGTGVTVTTGGVTVSAGTSTFSAPLIVSGTSSYLKVPSMTTTQRNALSSPGTGSIIYNSTTGAFEVNIGGTWYNWALVESP